MVDRRYHRGDFGVPRWRNIQEPQGPPGQPETDPGAGRYADGRHYQGLQGDGLEELTPGKSEGPGHGQVYPARPHRDRNVGAEGQNNRHRQDGNSQYGKARPAAPSQWVA